MVLSRLNKNSAILTKADFKLKRKISHEKCSKWRYSTVRSMKTATVWIEDGFPAAGNLLSVKDQKDANARGLARGAGGGWLGAVGFD